MTPADEDGLTAKIAETAKRRRLQPRPLSRGSFRRRRSFGGTGRRDQEGYKLREAVILFFPVFFVIFAVKFFSKI